jgi:AcrR family transcriptional regulator
MPCCRSMSSAKIDGRRQAGLRTQARLMDAALDLLSERGEGGVSLREVTGAADANVSAVSYHFGSLRSLCDAAVEEALEGYLEAQQAAVSELDPDSTLEELAAAFARPMTGAMAAGGRDLAVMRIVARGGIDPPRGWDRFDESFERIRAEVLRVLKVYLPDAADEELVFRTRGAAGLMNWVVLAPVGAQLRGKSQERIEALLVPMLVGTFRGTDCA